MNENFRKSLHMFYFFVTLRSKYVQMDVTQRYSIAYKGLKPGVHTFDFEVDGELFRAFESQEIKDGRCKVTVEMERSETQLVLEIGIRGEVVVECDRCLDDCTIPVEYDGELLVRISNEEGEYDGEVMWILPVEDEVDLSQYIYESIVLSLPYRRVHPDGECNPEMLKRFNIVSDEEFAAIEQKAENPSSGSQFAALSALRDRMEAEEKEK